MTTFGERRKKLRGETSQSELSATLGIRQTTLSNYERNRNEPNFDMFWKICSHFGVNFEWLMKGTGPMHKGDEEASPIYKEGQLCDVDLIMVPKVSARLAAGVGSLENSAKVTGSYAFRSDWLRRKGCVSQMVLMDVTGDSMAPKIENGDMVLIDQSNTNIIGYAYFAVSIDDAVYVKQLRQKPGQLILHSLNPDYDDITVDMNHDQPDSVRIIGRVIWVGRELA